MIENWGGITAELHDHAKRMHEAREAGLRVTRQLIQRASKCIKVHRRQFAEAREALAEAKAMAESGREALRPFPELYYAGHLQDAEKEYVEAASVVAIVPGEALPTPSELGVGPFTYLHGTGEAASEVRRFALDEMRKGSLAVAESILGTMETIYDDLTAFDYPDGMTGGLRRTVDALRAVVERTRSDLTATSVQHRLIDELRRHSSNPLIEGK